MDCYCYGSGGKRVGEVVVVVVELTHVGLVLEGVVAVRAAAVEVGGALAGEGAVGRGAVLGGPVALEALLDDGRILAVVVGVHLHVRRADVHLVASLLSFHERVHPKIKNKKNRSNPFRPPTTELRRRGGVIDEKKNNRKKCFAFVFFWVTGTCSRKPLAGYFLVTFWVLEHVLESRWLPFLVLEHVLESLWQTIFLVNCFGYWNMF